MSLFGNSAKRLDPYAPTSTVEADRIQTNFALGKRSWPSTAATFFPSQASHRLQFPSQTSVPRALPNNVLTSRYCGYRLHQTWSLSALECLAPSQLSASASAASLSFWSTHTVQEIHGPRPEVRPGVSE